MRGDGAVEAGADKLDRLSGKAAARGGVAGRLAGELADDASFLRKLKPSLIVRRARGELPKDGPPVSDAGGAAPSEPQHGRPRSRTSGPNPFIIAAAAFGIGTLVAKLIDWRGHAHPRR
jgi:hypothetical protein